MWYISRCNSKEYEVKLVVCGIKSYKSDWEWDLVLIVVANSLSRVWEIDDSVGERDLVLLSGRTSMIWVGDLDPDFLFLFLLIV